MSLDVHDGVLATLSVVKLARAGKVFGLDLVYHNHVLYG
jgi:hypothetical protein